MTKFTKSLAFGVAATMLLASTASYAACDRYDSSQNGDQQHSSSNQTGNAGSQYGGYQGHQGNGQLGSQFGGYQNHQGGGYQGGGQPGSQFGGYQGHQGGGQPGAQLGYNNGHNGGHQSGSVLQQSTSESLIFEIVDKENCTTDACEGLTLRDANGHQILVGDITFDEALTEETSLEELAYHLAQNGSAIRGSLELGGADGDAERTYNLHVEQIFS
jgi:hypothetical protein